MKTVIIKRNAYGKGQHKFNEQFRDFAQKHCGMQLKVCKPYRLRMLIICIIWEMYYDIK